MDLLLWEWEKRLEARLAARLDDVRNRLIVFSLKSNFDPVSVQC